MAIGVKIGMHKGLYLAYKDMGLSDSEIEEKIKIMMNQSNQEVTTCIK